MVWGLLNRWRLALSLAVFLQVWCCQDSLSLLSGSVTQSAPVYRDMIMCDALGCWDLIRMGLWKCFTAVVISALEHDPQSVDLICREKQSKRSAGRVWKWEWEGDKVSRFTKKCRICLAFLCSPSGVLVDLYIHPLVVDRVIAISFPPLWLSQSLARTYCVRTPCQNTASGVLSGYKSCSYQCLKKAQVKEMQAVRASVPAGTLILRWTTTPDPQNTSLWQGIQANYLVNHLV